MAASYVILVSIDGAFERFVDEGRLERVARRVLVAEGAAACELSVAVTDDETVQRLNREYAGEDYVTDVLSFSHVEGEEMVGPAEDAPSLGEVIIAYPQAERQAVERARDASGRDPLREPQGERRRGTDVRRAAQGERGWSVQQEIERLLAHGVLHLLGYDHAGPEEERKMREREDALSTDGGTG